MSCEDTWLKRLYQVGDLSDLLGNSLGARILLMNPYSNHHGLYTAFYRYFTQKWESHEIPDYDLNTDELVYREATGREIERTSFFHKDRMDLIGADTKEISPKKVEDSSAVRNKYIEQTT